MLASEALLHENKKKSSNKMLPPVSIEPLDLWFQVQHSPFCFKTVCQSVCPQVATIHRCHCLVTGREGSPALQPHHTGILPRHVGKQAVGLWLKVLHILIISLLNRQGNMLFGFDEFFITTITTRFIRRLFYTIVEIHAKIKPQLWLFWPGSSCV